MLALLALACHPHVRVDFLQPADITLPPSLVTVAIAQRAPSDEGAIAAGGLTVELYDGTRLQVAQADPGALARVPLPRAGALAPADVAALCAVTATDGVILVDGAGVLREDVASTQERKVEKNGVTRTVIDHVLTRTLTADATFTLYGCGGAALDSLTVEASDALTGVGRNDAEARGAIDPQDEAALAADLLAGAGATYAAHVVPTWAAGVRPYFRTGDPAIADGHRALRDDRLQAAEQAWTAVWNDGDGPKARGRAAFDLAVLAELRGDVRSALFWLRAARSELGDAGLVADYRAVLRQRKVDGRTVDAQLQTAP